MSVTLSTQFGRYSILRKLGEGGMGAVYLAEDTRLRRQVAIKVPNFDASADPRLIERFYREARLAAQMTHPNLCPIFDVDAAEGTHYLTMAFIEGKPLVDLIHPEQPWTPDRIVSVMKPLCSVLQLLHERGIVHRDLKPGNIMIRPDGSPVLMDFGLARCFTCVSQRITTDGRPMGTPSYMAPEQIIAEESAIGPHTDVWALGVILYQLLTGQVPFNAPSFAELGMRIFHADPMLPSRLRPTLDPSWDVVCLQAMNKDHRQRPAHAQAFAQLFDLKPQTATPGNEYTLTPGTKDPATAQQPHPTLSTTCRTSAHPALPAPGKRRKWPYVAGVASLAILTVAGLLLGGGMNKADSNTPDTPQQEAAQPVVSEKMTNSLGMEFVLLPAGRFWMGSPVSEKERYDDEGPQHLVELSRSYHLGVYEVTQEEYLKVTGKNPSYFSGTGGGATLLQGRDTRNFPVDSVTWEDAVAFCQKLSDLPEEKHAGRSYRLPTEAEWEYACRAGAKENRVFSFGDSLTSHMANFDGDNPYGETTIGPDLGRTTTVGRYPANAWGLCDMHGNVWEWTHDWYNDNYYSKSTRRDPKGPTTGERHALRGGSWFNNGQDCRSAYRDHDPIEDRMNRIGFRVVCVRATR